MHHLGALRRAMHFLDTYYQEYNTNPSLPLRNPTHPYPTSFVSRDGLVQHFTYLFHMTGRNLFFGRMDDTAICIKFVTRYCKEGHEFLAAKGFAPKLHAFESLPGGLYKDLFDADQEGQVIFISALYMGNFQIIPNTFQSDATYSNFSCGKLNPMLKTLRSVNT